MFWEVLAEKLPPLTAWSFGCSSATKSVMRAVALWPHLHLDPDARSLEMRERVPMGNFPRACFGRGVASSLLLSPPPLHKIPVCRAQIGIRTYLFRPRHAWVSGMLDPSLSSGQEEVRLH